MTKYYKPLFVVGSSALLYTLGTGAIWFLLPILSEKLFHNLFIAASLLAVPNVVSLIFNIPLGKLSDRTTRKKLILLGLSVIVFLGFMLPSLTTIYSLIIFLVLFGFGNLLIIVPSRAYVMEISPEHKTSIFFGIFETFIQVGFTIGPLVGGYLIADQFEIGVANTGVFSSISCVLALLAMLFLKDTITPRENLLASIKALITKDRVFFAGIKDYLSMDSSGLVVLLSTFLFVFIDGAIWAIEPLYTTQGIPPETAGLILAMFVLPAILFQAPAGWLADKFGKKKIFLFGVSCSSLSLMGFGMTYEPNILIMSAFFAATGIALASPAIDGLLTDISSGKERGGIVGVWDVAEDSAYILSPIIGGLIAETYGIGVTFLSLGIMLLLTLPLFHKMLKTNS